MGKGKTHQITIHKPVGKVDCHCQNHLVDVDVEGEGPEGEPATGVWARLNSDSTWHPLAAAGDEHYEGQVPRGICNDDGTAQNTIYVKIEYSDDDGETQTENKQQDFTAETDCPEPTP